MTDLLSINTIAITIFGYPLSYLELVGTIFTLASVWLVAINHIATWPTAIIGGVLFAILFYQINLYADLFEQFYYIVTGSWGWYVWRKRHNQEPHLGVITRVNIKDGAIYAAAIALATHVLGSTMMQLPTLLPSLFPHATSYVYLDAFTTVVSFTAIILMVGRKFECWYLWIAVDLIGIWLYWQKEVVFLSLLYVIFLGIALKGWWHWREALAQHQLFHRELLA